MKSSDIVLCIVVAFLWGAQVTAVKIAGIEIPPFIMLFIRFLVIALCLLPFARIPNIGEIRKMSVVVLFSTLLHFGFLYVGISLVSAATSAIIYQLSPIFTILLAIVFLREKFSMSVVVGVSIAVMGVISLFGGLTYSGSFSGGVLIALAALCFAVGTILAKRLGPFDPLMLNAWSAVLAIPVVGTVSVIVEADPMDLLSRASSKAWMAIAYTAFSGGVVGFLIWYHLLNRNPVSKLAPYTLLVPLFAVAVSEIVLQEGLDIHFCLNAALIFSGVAIAQLGLLNRLACLAVLINGRGNISS